MQGLFQKDEVAAWDYMWENVQPLVDAGMSVGLDASAAALPGSLDDQLAIKLEQQGVRVYIEARPRVVTPQWRDNPVVITEEFWHRSNPEKFSDSSWGAPNHDLDEEVVRLIRYEPALETLKKVLLNGNVGTIYPMRLYAEDRDYYLGSIDNHLQELDISAVPTQIHLTEKKVTEMAHLCIA